MIMGANLTYLNEANTDVVTECGDWVSEGIAIGLLLYCYDRDQFHTLYRVCRDGDVLWKMIMLHIGIRINGNIITLTSSILYLQSWYLWCI